LISKGGNLTSIKFDAIAGPIGALAGAIIGGIAGGIGAKAIADQFIEDDRVEMFAQLKEEFIDIIIIVALSEDELEKVQKAIFKTIKQVKVATFSLAFSFFCRLCYN